MTLKDGTLGVNFSDRSFITFAPIDLELWQDNKSIGEAYFQGSVPPSQKVSKAQRSQFLGVPFYLRVHHLTQNDQICRGNT